MKAKIYLLLTSALALTFSWSCTNENESVTVVAGEAPVSLSGAISRAAEMGGEPVYLTAFPEGDMSEAYIAETPIYATGGLTLSPKDLLFTDATPYYPLGQNIIRFFAYTGRASGGNMQLTAGNTVKQDYILSNTGMRENDPDDTVMDTYEGEGTPGNSENPAELLQFRHVMTQLNVKVVVDTLETVIIDPVPIKVQFTMDSISATGTYPITAKAPVAGSEAGAEVATGTGSYTVALGTNYLVPTGANLVGKRFSSLVIDDYTATEADLSGFTIQPVSGEPDLTLYPGAAYDLTITVQRLRVTSVKIQPVRWKAQELDDNEQPGYTPYTLTLNVGSSYQDSGDDLINKVLLRSSDNLTYIGSDTDGDGVLKFVTLPQAGTVVSADLYTSKGLLISTPVTSYDGSSLNLMISAGGMIPQNPDLPVAQDNPYLITTPVQLLNVYKEPGSYYKLARDIDLGALVVEDDYVFTGLGDFDGEFDGGGFWISEVNVTGSGLFATNTGILRNIRIFTGTIDARDQSYAGSICGTNNGTVVACLNEAFVRNSTATVGGICGLNDANGQILASINTGNVTNGNTVGGVCGHNLNVNSGAIAACLNTGWLDVKATNLGGICGTSLPTLQSIIRTCYWLVGTAQREIGEHEVAIATEGILLDNVSDLDPNKMRNGLNAGELDDERIINKLDKEMEKYPQWNALYKYRLNYQDTGITWPAPVKI